jgi:branched-chain amino acid transport system permease protein
MKRYQFALKALKKHPIVFVFVLTTLVIPLFTANYTQRLVSEIFYYAAMAVAWNLVGGYAKQTSWAHATFLASGAYTGMLMYLKADISPWIGMIVGMIISVAIAIIIGLPTFKLRGVYFAIATISCGEIALRLLLYFSDFTGGANGLMLRALEHDSVWLLRFSSETPFYYIGLLMMFLFVFLSNLIKKSRFGYYLRAIRNDEDAAETLGIRSYRIKLLILVISAVMTSAVGSIYAFRLSYIDPMAVASHDVAVRIGITAIIGGLNTLWGPVLGAILTVPLMQITNRYFGSVGGGGVSWIIYSAVIILFVLFKPGGVIAIYNDFVAKFKKRRKIIQ